MAKSRACCWHQMALSRAMLRRVVGTQSGITPWALRRKANKRRKSYPVSYESVSGIGNTQIAQSPVYFIDSKAFFML